MNEPKTLFALNPDLDREALAREFAKDHRIQVRDVLTTESATEIRDVLSRHTPWGMAAQADGSGFKGAQKIDAPFLSSEAGRERAQQLLLATHQASQNGAYAFRYAHFSLVEAAGNLDGNPFEVLLEHLNAPAFLGLVRDVTGISNLVKADGQATLFGPQHYLGRHIDSHVAEGWRIAYVLNFAPDDWHPDWGGYLNFYDENGDISAGYKPRFNALNMFLVPRPHAVSFVSPFAPASRFAITGWLRDR